MENFLPVFAPVRDCVRFFGISESELLRWIQADWVRTKKCADISQGRFTVRTTDIWSVINNLGKSTRPRAFKDPHAVVNWNPLTRALSVKFTSRLRSGSRIADLPPDTSPRLPTKIIP